MFGTNMLHKHHSTHHVVGMLLGILFIGGIFGGMSGLMQKSVVSRSDALNETDGAAFLTKDRRERLQRTRAQRTLRREKRMEQTQRIVNDVSSTYPMQVNTFAYKGTTRWDTALNLGTLSYKNLGIVAPLGKPTMTSWKNRDWRALEDQMQYLLLNGLGIYPHSPEPGGKGSVIIAGHSSPPTMEAVGSPYEDIFAVLPGAKIGDRIVVTGNDAVSHIYEVVRTQVVPSSYTQILLQDPVKTELVLFTCYPIGTTRDRFVVWADHVGEGDAIAAK